MKNWLMNPKDALLRIVLSTPIGGEKTVSYEEEKQFLQAMHDLEEFTKVFAKKYPKLFKNGCCCMKAHPSIQPAFFPYTVSRASAWSFFLIQSV